jgi:trigger factor
MKVGEEKSFSLTLPDTYPDENKRGQEASFEVKVKQIQEKKLPELDDEFAKDLGQFESLDDLKERIRKDLKHDLAHRREEKIEADLRQELLNRNQFATPPSMVRARYNYINAMQDMQYQRYGASLKTMAQQDEGLLARNEKTAEEEVRLSIVLDAIAQKEGLEISDDEYVAYINRLAREANADPKTYLIRIESQGLDTFYRRNALEEKVMNYLKTITVASPEDQAESSPSED